MDNDVLKSDIQNLVESNELTPVLSDSESQNCIINEETDQDKKENASEEEEKEDEWLDILGSGQLMKKIVTKGREDTRPQRSDLCTVKYVAKYQDKVVEEGNVTINLGDAELIQGLDFVLPLMNLEEEAEIIIGPRFAYGSEGRDPDIPPDATLHYTVTLVSTEPEPFLETLPLQTRKDIGNRKKERGNYWYSRKDHTLAIQCYRRALEYLDDSGLTSEEKKTVTEDDGHSLLEDRIKVYNNLAAAQMKIKAFDTALQSVDNVLRCQPDNVKALFRKGKIMAEKGETEEGISLLKKVLSLDSDNVQAKNELNQLLARRKKDTDQQKKLYKKMLGTNKPAENKPSLQPTGRRWGLVATCVCAIILIGYNLYKPF